jgi:hypothetical protein
VERSLGLRVQGGEEFLEALVDEWRGVLTEVGGGA